MFTIRKATSADCGLIHKLAWQIFPETYKEILSKEQIEYMMEWMYSLESIRQQMEEEGHVYLIACEECEAAGYVSVQQQGKDLFHLQKIYVLPYYQGAHCGSFLFREAVKYIRDVHPAPCIMELNVNRNNKAVGFYEHMGMKKSREGDFPIGNGYYMNDYIMQLKSKNKQRTASWNPKGYTAFPKSYITFLKGYIITVKVNSAIPKLTFTFSLLFRYSLQPFNH